MPFGPAGHFLLDMVVYIQACAQNKINVLLDIQILKRGIFPVEGLGGWLVVDDIMNCHSKICQGMFVKQFIDKHKDCTADVLLL